MRTKSQVIRDESRVVYRVGYPTDLPTEPVLAWLRSIPSALTQGKGSAFKRDTLAFETWATPSGISHRIIVPKRASEYAAAQLRTHGRGITVTQDDTREPVNWTAGVTVGMSSPLRQLRIAKHSDLAASLLGAMQALQGDEMLMLQWVVHPAQLERPPAGHTSTSEFSLRRAILGNFAEASNDEVTDRRAKLIEQNLLGIGRIVAKADNPKRADELIRRVKAGLDSAGSATNHFAYKTGKNVINDANDAASVTIFPNQFTVSELAAVIAWPIGSPFVAGLPKGATRHVYATDDIQTEGFILGDSNYPGHERPVAIKPEWATEHMVVVGSNGTGKTGLSTNVFAQVVDQGYGGIVIDASNSESSQTMFRGALRYIPAHRLNDVIVMDIQSDRANPVGFNILDQGNPRVVADQIMELFAHLYSDTSGVWTKRLLFFGIYTLAERSGLTLADLMPLLNRKTPEEAAWADELIRSVKDRDIKDFWREWENFSPADRDRYTQPLLNRIWQLVSRPEVRDIIGQSKSSFQIKDVLAENKILLVNLAGLPSETSSILGTLLVNAVWSAAQSMRPDKPNFLFLDEFQVMTSKLPLGLGDLLSRARKHNLGLVMATQFIDQVPPDVKQSVLNNARTKVIFRVSSQEARIWRSEFGRTLDDDDFLNVNPYEVVARVASTGGSTPVTFRTRPPRAVTGTEREAVRISRSTYGRPIADVEAERDNRRAAEKPKGNRPKVGYDEWKRGDQ